MRLAPKDFVVFDRSGSVRSYDSDGHLHVEIANISKATVNSYFAREIPGAVERGMDPDKTYMLFRDPAELLKAASTFAGKPILIQHTAISADDHPHEKVIGAIGTDVQFSAPYLTAPLTIWDGEAIKLIESGEQRALSCGYRFSVDWTPGVFDNMPYVGRMINIGANHLALVEEGRAGPSVVIGDSKHKEDIRSPLKETINMAVIVLSRKATLAHGGVLGFVRPLLAKDAALPDLTSAFAGVTSKNFKASQPKIIGAIAEVLRGKIATDSSLDGLPGMLAALDAMIPADETEEEKCAREKTAKDAEGDPAGEAGGETDTAVEAAYAEGYADGMEDGMGTTEASHDARKTKYDKRIMGRKTAKDDATKENPPSSVEEKDKNASDKMISQKAMDAAVTSAAKLAEKNITTRMKDAREAERFVRPWVGELAVTYDTGEEILRASAVALGVPDAATIHVSALKAMIGMMPKPGERAGVTRLAADNALRSTEASTEFNKLFPTSVRPRTI